MLSHHRVFPQQLDVYAPNHFQSLTGLVFGACSLICVWPFESKFNNNRRAFLQTVVKRCADYNFKFDVSAQ